MITYLPAIATAAFFMVALALPAKHGRHR